MIFRFLLSGELVDCDTQEDFFEYLRDRDDVILNQVQILESDDPSLKYVFCTNNVVTITKRDIQFATRNIIWADVVNESFLKICIEHQTLFPALFENPHPLVVEALKRLDKDIPLPILKFASSNSSPEVFQWLQEHYADKIYWDWACCKHTEAAMKHYEQKHDQIIIPSYSKLNLLIYSNTKETIDWMIQVHGGIDEVMVKRNFMMNNCAYANELKRRWLQENDRDVDMVHYAENMLIWTEDNELARFLIDFLCQRRAYVDGLDLIARFEDHRIWIKPCECIVDLILTYLNTHPCSTLHPFQLSRLSLNENPRVIRYLLDHRECIEIPEFFTHPDNEVVQYAIEWLSANYERLCSIKDSDFTDEFDQVSENVSCNTHVDMILAMQQRFPKLIDRQEWLYAIGKNNHVHVVLKD